MKGVAIVLILCMVGSALGRAFRKNQHYTSYYHSLRPFLREAFLQFQLAKGVIKHSQHEQYLPSEDLDNLLSPEGLRLAEPVFHDVQSLEPPDGFNENLYENVKSTYELTINEVATLASRYYVCIGRPQICYDIGDVGSNCC